MEISGHIVHFYDEVTSTNDVLKKMLKPDSPKGLSVVAGSQTAGRGRQGKTWHSPAGMGVYLSTLIYPKIKIEDAGLLAITGGLAVAEMLAEVGIKGITIKWPNDVLINGKKIAGVLVEPQIKNHSFEHAVVGIGVNLKEHTESPVANISTSCEKEGCDIELHKLLSLLLTSLEKHYDLLNNDKRQQLLVLSTRYQSNVKVF